MNREFVLFNLRDAQAALSEMIKEIEEDETYGYGEYTVAMAHLYHHMNTAWNAQDSSDERARACSQQDFEQWSGFPSDLAPLGTI